MSISLPSTQQKKADTQYKRTSHRMALQIWQGYTAKYPDRFNNRGLPERLRLAHTLLLRFREVYFSQLQKEPSLTSQEWLVLRALNDRDSHHWHIIG